MHKQVHLHQPTINGTVSGLINGAYVTGGTVGAVSGIGNISGGTFGVELFTSKKRDQEVSICFSWESVNQQKQLFIF